MNGAKRPSESEWIGPLPLDWDVVPVKHCTDYVSRGRSPDYSDDDDGIPIVNQACIYWDGLRLANVKRQRREMAAGQRGRLRKNDLLINSTGTGTLGRAVVFSEDGEFFADSHVTIVRGNSALDPRFLRYVVQSEIYQGFIYSVLAPGATNQIELSREGLRAMPIPFPRPEIQSRIADFLDHKTAAIDDLVTKKERVLGLLLGKRQALITQAVTKGINQTVHTTDSGVPWIGRIPGHWKTRRIKFLCRLESGHTPSRTEPSYWIPEECIIPWVSLNDTKTLEASDYISDTAVTISETGMANSSAHMIPGGAVVFNRDGARVGLAAITTRAMAVSQHIIAWVCGPLIINTFLLNVIYAMQDELVRLTTGATIPTIGMGDVRELVAPLPPIEEQEQIVSALLKGRGEISSTIDAVRMQVERLREYRQALITAAVTGKLDVDRAGSQTDDRVARVAEGA